MVNNRITLSEDLVFRLDKVNARGMVATSIRTARIFLKVLKAENATRKAEILLGTKEGCRKDALAAKTYRYELNSHIDLLKEQVEEFLNSQKEHEGRWTDFVKSGKIKDFTQHARNQFVMKLLDVNVGYASAERALKQFDASIEKLHTLSTITSIEKYVFDSWEEQRSMLSMDWDYF